LKKLSKRKLCRPRLPRGGLAPVFAVLALALSGCGAGRPSPGETAPFQRAVEDYLRQHGMGMRVHAFRSLVAEGDRARAVVSLREASGAVGVGVQWRFEFARRNGKWVVTRRE